MVETVKKPGEMGVLQEACPRRLLKPAFIKLGVVAISLVAIYCSCKFFGSLNAFHSWLHGADVYCVSAPVPPDAESPVAVEVECRNLTARKVVIHSVLLQCSCLQSMADVPVEIGPGSTVVLPLDVLDRSKLPQRVEFLCSPAVAFSDCVVQSL